MKPFFLIILFLLAINGVSNAQNPVTDTHPGSVIFAIDYSTNQEVAVATDYAILFKDAFIDLVTNTPTAKMQIRVVPGRKSFVITQMNPQTSGDAYQLVFQSKFLNQNIPIYTFVYNVDQNTLSFFNPGTQSYVPQLIQGYNLNNLNNCLAYGKFNDPNPQQPAQDANMQTQPVQDASFADNNDAPVDTGVSVATIPPDMPDYDQPECPEDGYLWQPGYWAYSQETNGYYWVPGAWVAPPSPELLWTPPYWAFVNGLYLFHAGYWGPTVGFYGGIDYGYGYGGVGFVGGEWHEGHFRYNTAVLRVNVGVVHNTYVDRSVYRERGMNHASFNGRGGFVARPNAHEMAAMREHHVMATHEQIRNQRMARADKGQFASPGRGGRPANLASPRVAPGRGQGNFNHGPGNQGNTGGGARAGNQGPNGGGARPGNQGPNGGGARAGNQGPNGGGARPGNQGPNGGGARPGNQGATGGGARPSGPAIPGGGGGGARPGTQRTQTKQGRQPAPPKNNGQGKKKNG